MYKSSTAITFLFFAIVTFFTSCKKDYTCTCSYADEYKTLMSNEGDESNTSSFLIPNATKDVAEKKCQDEAAFNYLFIMCELD